ncbi:Ig-like domain repeat protein [Candidatus Gracilibacteria bacterium]|nr:Ig-like domain repeat protein [Candidatus Gracilibacteria bacterium]MCF7819194.1 Ig-like domain repeat protein [Candidatus Gracilibacteria bacterium]
MRLLLPFLEKKGKRLVAVFALGSLFLFGVPAFVFAADMDSDGLDDAVDNNNSRSIFTPFLNFPRQLQGIPDENLSVIFRGSGEIETQVRLFEEEEEVCSASVEGDGLSLGKSNAVKWNEKTLFSETVVGQFFYNTENDSISDWRSNSNSSWYAESRDDREDHICDYQLGDGDADPRNGADDRCHQASFPLKALLMITSDTLFIFDGNGGLLWKKIPVSGPTSIAALNGVVYVGTENGLVIFDFVQDSFDTVLTSSTTPAIIHNKIHDLATKTIQGKSYIVLATEGGTSILNATDSAIVSRASSSVTSVSITDQNQVLMGIGSTTLLSPTIDQITSNWTSLDISVLANFSSGLNKVLHENFVVHSSGVSHVERQGALIRNIHHEYATLPLKGEIQGHWVTSLQDRSPKSHTLTNNGEVQILAPDEGAEVKSFVFDGNNYLSSDNQDFDLSGTQLTVGMWIKRPDTGGTGAYQKILNRGDSRETRSYWLSAGDSFFDYPLEEDPYFFGVQTDQGFAAVSVQTPPSPDTWEFIVGTYDGENIKIYRNGSLENTVPHTGNILSNEAEKLYFGYGYENEYFTGNISLPFITEGVYTEEEIEEVYSLSQHWLEENATISLHSNTGLVNDVYCHTSQNICYIATSDGITKLDTSTGLTTAFSQESGIQSLVSTNIGEWECTATLPAGGHTVFTRAYVSTNASDKTSSSRTFYNYEPGATDIDGDGILNEDDNNPFVPLEKPTINNIQETEEASQTYSLSGTGDGGTDQIRTRVAGFVKGETTPRFYAEVSESGQWQTSEEISFEVGDYTLFVRGYIEDNASNIDSEETFLTVESLQSGSPTLNSLPEFSGQRNILLSWGRNIGSDRFQIQTATNQNFTENLLSSDWISDTSYTFQNLSEGQKHYFRVRSKDKNGNQSDFSEAVSTTIDITPPTGQQVSGGGPYVAQSDITFEWNNFTDSGGSGIDHFEVFVDRNSSFSSPLFQSTHFVGTSKVFSGTHGETYFARVKAVDKAGNKSNYVYSSGVMVDVTPPTSFSLHPFQDPAPTGAKTISWTTAGDAESGIQQYEIFKEELKPKTTPEGNTIWEPVTELSSIGTTTNQNFVDENIQDGWFYVYKIVATNKAGAATETDTAQFRVDSDQAHPPAFQNMQHYWNQDEVSLQWSEATDIEDISGYELFLDGESSQSFSGTALEYIDASPKEDGTVYEYKVRATADSQTGTFSEVLKVLMDKSAPQTVSSAEGERGNNDWYVSPVVVTLQAQETGEQLFDVYSSRSGTGFFSGVDQILYNKNETGITPYTGQITIGNNGVTNLAFSATDRAGNQEAEQIQTLKIDTEDPTATFSFGVDIDQANGFFNGDEITFSVASEDSVSGVESVTTYVRFDQNGDGALAGVHDFKFSEEEKSKISHASGASDSGTYTFSRDGKYEFKVVVVDKAGNTSETALKTINVDRTAPSTIDNAPDSGAVSAPYTITLTANDQAVSSGIEGTYYTVDGSPPTIESSSGTKVVLSEEALDENGFFVVKYFSVDGMGNRESAKIATNNPLDSDGDGMSDQYELSATGDSAVSLSPEEDADSDGLTNLEEYQQNTNPLLSDSDADTVGDGGEVSDGTDPNDSQDHRVLLIAPQTGAFPTNTPFTFLAKAPVGKTVSIKSLSGGGIGSGKADSSGRVFIELSLAAGNIHEVIAEFIHQNGQIVTTKDPEGINNFSFDVEVSNNTNPQFLNVSEGTLFAQGFINIQVQARPNAQIELFQIQDGNLVSLSQTQSNEEGIAELGLPTTFVGGKILAVDQDNLLTSEIIQVYRSVTAKGQVLDTEGVPVNNAIVKFIQNDSIHYTTSTDENGNYTNNIPRNTEYLVKIYHRYYKKYEETIVVGEQDPKISPALERITDLHVIQTEEGLERTEGGEKVSRFPGMERGETKQVLEEPTQTYEESLEEVQELQEGREGEVLTHVDSFGREIFGGYQAGRIAVEEFKVQPEVARKITGLLGAERRKAEDNERFLQSARSEVCLSSDEAVGRPADVVAADQYARHIYKINAYQVFPLDEQNNFYPQKTVTWEEVLRAVLDANCIQPMSMVDLRKTRVPELQNIPLENTQETLLLYTAFEKGIIGANFDPKSTPTRKEVLLILASAFPLEVNEKATNSSFVDISSEDPLAPLLVAAKINDWFDGFEEKTFDPQREITRAEFSVWFLNAFEHKKENITQKSAFQKFIEKLRGKTGEQKQARPGVRVTSRPEAESHLTGRAYREKIAEEQQYYQPTRASWNPIDPNTTRAPLWREDKSDNVRRPDSNKRILRNIEEAIDRIMQLRRESEEQSKEDDDVGMSRQIYRGN